MPIDTVKTVTVMLKGRISPQEIPYLRGAMIRLVGAENDVLLHNHEGDSLRYAYPLIQYKIVSGEATVVFINEGIDSAEKLISSQEHYFRLGKRDASFVLDKIIPEETSLLVSKNPHEYHYRISGWLPLNSENYSSFVAMDSLIERVAFLERILVVNILAMAKGVGIFLEGDVKCTICDIASSYFVEYKSNNLKAFDLEFKTNVKLPDCIGLGKHSSVGFGTIERIY